MMKKYLYKLERIVLKIIRKLIPHSQHKGNDTYLMSGKELNKLIYKAISGEKPYMIARFGSVEFESGAYPYILSRPIKERYNLFFKRRVSYLHKDEQYENGLIVPLCNNAGFFPKNPSLIPAFSKLMQEDVSILDCCCTCDWIDYDLFAPLYKQDIQFAKLEDMEPYDYDKPWSKALEKKRVLVVHPFVKSIRSQYEKRELIWENENVLPEFELITIRAVQTMAGEKAPFANWFEALEYMKKQMDEIEYDVAIIGCGAYGFHLAAHAKRTGHKAIHLGGATQILFGIKGKRWEQIPEVSKFFNEHWVNPLPEETPMHKDNVEGGCYW